DGNLAINMGSFDLGAVDARVPGFDISKLDPNIIGAAQLLDNLPDSPFKSFLVNARTPSLAEGGAPPKGFTIPLIDDPTKAFGLLMGKDVDLFRYDLPKIVSGT